VNAYGTVTADGDLEMLTSTIATLGGGNVNVFTADLMDLGSEDLSNSSRQVGFGIFTAGAGNVSVIAGGDIDIDGSRIATYNGGNIFVESYAGSVDVGSGGNSPTGVYLTYVDPATGLAGSYAEDVYGSGIIANTLVPGTAAEGYPPAGVGIASVPGNITVETPEGNITTTEGGITQIALDGNLAAGPTISLSAGSPGYVENIYIGESGVIGGTVNITATGGIVGQGFLETTPNTQSNVTAVAGTNIEFLVNASGSQPISYQWFENGSSLPSQTNDFLSLTNINRSDAALYSIITSNAAAMATNTFLLHVQVPERMNASLSPDGQTLQVSFSDADGGLPTEQDISSFVIETSPDLMNWTVTSLPITTNAGGGLSFEVPAITSSGNAYYRIISQ
jgi:Immunoglobulin I-set domain